MIILLLENTQVRSLFLKPPPHVPLINSQHPTFETSGSADSRFEVFLEMLLASAQPLMEHDGEWGASFGKQRGVLKRRLKQSLPCVAGGLGNRDTVGPCRPARASFRAFDPFVGFPLQHAATVFWMLCACTNSLDFLERPLRSLSFGSF